MAVTPQRTFGNRAFWLSVAERGSITDDPLAGDATGYAAAEGVMPRAGEQAVRNGYFNLGPVVPAPAVALLADIIQKVVAAGYPAVFAAVYDEFWQVLMGLRTALAPLLGGDVQLLPEFWVWHIAADGRARGFPPHRDNEFAGRAALREDGRPLILTAWIPLTDVSLDHSCIFVLPTNLDPHLPDRIDDYSVPLDSLQSVRAMPAQAGTVLGWNQHLLHWGSRSTARATGPRLSIGAYFQSSDVSPFGRSVFDGSKPISFEDRIGPIAHMVCKYEKLDESQHISPNLLDVCLQLDYLHRALEERRLGRDGGPATP